MATATGSETLTSLLNEINMAEPEMFKPPHELRDDDTKLGVIEDLTLRKMYSLAQVHRREQAMAVTEARFLAHDDEQIKVLVQTILDHREMADALMALFWLALRKHLNVWCNSIGLRRGWVVVEPAEEQINPFAKLFGGE